MQSSSHIPVSKKDQRVINRNFFTAVEGGDFEKVKHYLGKGANINTQDGEGLTALHIAVENENAEIIKFLLQNGAIPDIKSHDNETPLDLARRLNEQRIIELFNQQIKPKPSQADVSGKKKQKRSDPVHGNIYQLKLLMLFLYRGVSNHYSFHLGTEIEEAKKFDDLVFKYDEHGQTKYRLLQAKHRLNQNEKVTSDNLLTEENDDYTLVKYFFSYVDAKKEKMFKNGTIKDVIISTNIGLDFNDLEKNGLVVQEITNFDNIIDTKGKSNRYQFTEELIPKLKPMLEDYNLTRLARRLVECLLKSNQMADHQKTDIFYFYHGVLASEVINTKTKRFHDKFIEGKDLCEITERFRKTFIDELSRQSKEKVGIDNLNQAIKDKVVVIGDKNTGLVLSKNFGKSESSQWPGNVISDGEVKEFLDHLVFAVNQPNEEELGQIIKNEIGQKLDLDLVTTENTYNKFFITMLNWLQGKEGDRFLSSEEGREFFEEAKRGIPILFNIQNPVSSFTGRGKELNNLHEALQNDGRAIVSQSVSISGLGGVGKSELAKKYISKHSQGYDNKVLWMNAESHSTLSESFRRLASDKLGIDTKNVEGKEKDIKSIVEDVYRFFSKGKSLFIFDNAEEFKGGNGISEFLSSLPDNMNKPHILVTSRNTKWPKGVSLFKLNTFTPKEAIEFIKKVLEIEGNGQEEDVKRLAETLQYFPLALQQAVAYIKVKNQELKNVGSEFKINDYINRYEEKTRELLDFKFPEDSDNTYTKTTIITWEITLDHIRERENGDKAIDIMNIIAYFAPDNISTEMFFNLISDKEELGSAIQLLKQYSMVNSGQEEAVLNIHRLVQQVTRIELNEQNKEGEYLGKGFKLLKASFPYGEEKLEDYSAQRKLLPHLEVFLSHMDNWLMRNPDDGQKVGNYLLILIIMADGYSNLGNPYRTKELLERALDIKEKHYGRDHVEVAKTLGNLGTAYGALGDPNKQKELLERALDIKEKHYGRDHVEVAKTLGNLGTAYGALGDPNKKKDLLEQALHILEKHYGRDNIEVVRTLENLGNAYGGLDNHKEAKKLLEEALEIKKRHYEPDHFNIATTLQNLGKTHGVLGDYQKARVLLESALEIYEKHYGSNHPEVARILGNLGNVYRYLEDYKKAKELLERALHIEEKYYVHGYFKVAETLVNLGAVYGKLGDHDKRKELFERALTIEEKYYGCDHFEVAKTLGNLGNAYGDLGDPNKQKELLERALDIKEKHYGRDHVEVAKTLGNLGTAYGALGNPNKQKELLERALPILERNNHPAVSQVRERLSTPGSSEYPSISSTKKEDTSSDITKLHVAVNDGNMEAVDDLLCKGADITQVTSEKGNTVLHIAVSKGNSELVEVLLKYAKQLSPIRLNNFINAKTTTKGTTVLHIAAQKDNLNVIKLLLHNGATYNSKNKDNKTPSELTASYEIQVILNSVEKLFEAVKRGDNKQVAQLLEEEKMIINSRDNDGGGTSLYWSISQSHTHTAQLLLENGADPTLVTNKGTTPLHIASSKGNNEIMVTLLDKVKNNCPKNLNNFVNAQTIGGTAALHIASSVEVAKSLLGRGAIYNIKNKEGKTPLDSTKNDNIRDLLNLTHELFEDAKNGNDEIIDKLRSLEREESEQFIAVTNARNEQGHTLFEVAITNRHENIARKLSEIMSVPMPELEEAKIEPVAGPSRRRG